LLSHRFYYSAKPWLPWRLRIAIRRLWARRVRKRCADSWPILESAGRKPEGWRGWPDGKQFAFVLTHDVESQVGLERVKPLAELEMQLGFRSSFNFIPEGPYAFPLPLRAWLLDHGFEVGVHDLHHDGKLYRNREHFRRCAQKINHYLKEWNAVGFRSGFMHHNLDWLHDLNIEYDASTFDTDPFEPQPDGVGTIFPFWVSAQSGKRQAASAERKAARAKRQAQSEDSEEQGSGASPLPLTASPLPLPASRSGYVELPYTIPQDSTLFLTLRERTADIWLRKLDWVARHGGMALLNVHPDYVHFDGQEPVAQTFRAKLYAELLGHARQRHAGAFWQPLPNQVARFVNGLARPPVYRNPRRVCMLTHSVYVSDGRVIRYAEALAARGDHVDVVSLQRVPGAPEQETVSGVNVFHLQSRFRRLEQTHWDYLWPLARFLLVSAWWITRHHWRQPYDLLHIHNFPDSMVFAAWYPRLAGAPIILDIHDIQPEFYANKFGRPAAAVDVKLLTWIERASGRFAHHVILANHLWLDKYAARTGTKGRCSVFLNLVDTQRFHARHRPGNNAKPIVLFPGGLQWHQGVDIAIRAFQKVSSQAPEAEFHIYGDGNMKASLVALTRDLGLDGRVRFFDPVPVNDIVGVMAAAAVGVVPKRADSFGNDAYSTKIMEFMSLGVPVVVSDTRIDRYYFDDSVVRFFESGNADALAEAILEVLRDEKLHRDIVARASAYAARNSWETRKADYLRLVDELCDGRRTTRLRDYGPQGRGRRTEDGGRIAEVKHQTPEVSKDDRRGGAAT